MQPTATPVLDDPDREVTERLARFARSRHPRDLWPTLTDSALTTARKAITSTVRAVLASRTPAALDATTAADAYALRIAAYTSGAGPLLGRWIEDGRLRASVEIQRILLGELDQGRRRVARMEREVMPALDALLASGITPIVLKGFHLGRAYFEEPGVRPGADVDLIVPPRQIPDAERVLAGAGFEPSPRRAYNPYEVHWKGVGVAARVYSVEGVHERNRWEIDLHDSFGRLFGARNVRLDPELRFVSPFGVAGRALLAPAQPLLVVYLACNISVDLQSMRLMRLVDLVRVIQRDTANGTLDWDAIVAHLRHTDSLHCAYFGLVLAEQLCQGTVPSRVLADSRAACNWAIKRVAQRLSPDGSSAARTSVFQYLIWVRHPVDLVKLIGVLLTESGRFSWRRVLTRSRALFNRVISGTVSFGPSDETST